MERLLPRFVRDTVEMKIVEDPYYMVHLQKTFSRLIPLNLYVIIALAGFGVFYAIGVFSWLGFSIVLSISLSVKLLAYFRILTAKRQLQKHRSLIEVGE